MQRRNFEAWIRSVNATVADAASRFCREPGKKVDSISESVLEKSIFEKFVETHHLVRQMGVAHLWRRNCPAEPMPHRIGSMEGQLIDLVGLTPNLGSRETWTGYVVIELKLWDLRKFDADQYRIESLLRYVPNLWCGLRVMLIDQPSTNPWVEHLHKAAEEEGHGWACDPVDCRSASGQQCSVIGEATYRS